MDREVYLLLISTLAVSGLIVVGGKQLPSSIQKCKLNSPDTNTCMKHALTTFGKRLQTGMTDLKLPSLDPYMLPKADFEMSWMNGSLTNIRLYSSHTFEIESFDMDLDRGTIEIMTTLPKTQLKAHYDVDGKLLQFTIHGVGEVEVNGTDVVSSITMRGKKIMKKGQEYFKITDIDYKLVKEPKTSTYFYDLFRNNPDITARVNQVIQENQDSLYKEVYPIVTEIVSAVTLSLFQTVFDNYSLKELFD